MAAVSVIAHRISAIPQMKRYVAHKEVSSLLSRFALLQTTSASGSPMWWVHILALHLAPN
jgi:hypothetical protein